ncbi:Hypothetical predicted protein [Mytilus galloprovincialis]|uniref:EGF-like domain-containing protein n=1 Tax=Mytilus galloprovincialis TaxID=29158 RepID=A0A8B6CJ74_MYTGA|nr:Hypothetical predicted protein [Mytilus galloprovincialis]
MQLYLLVILGSVFVIGNAVFTCTNGQKQCNLSSWLQWSNCTSSCGGGTSGRFKSLCCDTTYTSIRKCATDCNITTKDYIEDKVCGQTCVNGVFRQNKCQCQQRFTGKCCESEITTLPWIHNGSTTPHYSSTNTSKSCKQGCKLGDCNAGKCSCMTLFKGSTCNKPKPWFIVAAAVLGTIAFMMTVCCIGRFCCGYGKKVEADQTETRVNKLI